MYVRRKEEKQKQKVKIKLSALRQMKGLVTSRIPKDRPQESPLPSDGGEDEGKRRKQMFQIWKGGTL